jgi:hypothetical protein
MEEVELMVKHFSLGTWEQKCSLDNLNYKESFF